MPTSHRPDTAPTRPGSPGGSGGPRPGDELGDYLLCDPLTPTREAGDEPRTFHALDLRSGRSVALTVLPGSEDVLQHFLEDYRQARRRVPSPSFLPTILDGGVLGGWAYLATRRVPGIDLEAVLSSRSLRDETAVQILWALTLCLVQLHGRGLAHGDLHPRNVRVDPEGQLFLVGNVPHPFGQHRRARSEVTVLRHYLPPEAREEGVYDPVGDVYSLGLVLYRSLSHEPLMPAGTEEGLEEGHARARAFFSQGQARLARLPPGLAELVGRMLAADPADRPSDGDDLMEALFLSLPGTWRFRQLSEELADLFRSCAWRPAGALLERVDRQLAAGDLLGAAAGLVRFDDLAAEVGPMACRAAQRHAVELLWSTFREPQGRPGQAAGICQLLLGIDWTRYPRFLTPLVRARLAAVGSPGSREDLPPGPDPERDRHQRREVRDRLRREPEDEVSILELATLLPGLRFPEGASLDRMRAVTLAEAGLPQLALGPLARLLGRAADPRQVLEEVRDLCDAVGEGLLAGDLERDVVREQEAAGGRDLESDVLAEPAGEGEGAASVEALPEDPDVMFSSAQVLVAEGRLAEACEVFLDLLEVGVLTQRAYFSVLCTELRNLMWRALVPTPDAAPRSRLMRGIWNLARRLEIRTLVPLCESLLLTSLTGEDRYEQLEELLEVSPDSIRFLRAAAEEARARGEEEVWRRHLVAAGWEFLRRWDLHHAARMFMAARTLGPSEDLDAAREETLRVGEAMAETAREFRDLQADLAGLDAEERTRQVRAFVRSYPYFTPAHEVLAATAREAGAVHPATEMLLTLVRAALYREEFRKARLHLRELLEIDWENDEALLYLAALAPPGLDAPRHPKLLRVELLAREGLSDAAMHRLRRALRGEEGDVPFLQAMVELCERFQRDPAPYRARLALLALEREDPEEARRLLAQALEESSDVDTLVGILGSHPEIFRIMSPSTLEVARGE